MYEVDHGAITPLWAATAPEAEDANGKVRSVVADGILG